MSLAAHSLQEVRARYLQGLVALLQATGVLPEAALQSVAVGAGNYFDEIVQSSSRGNFSEEARGLTSSRLTLVGEEELELEIRLVELVSHLLEAGGNDLWKVHLRFITLLNRPDLPKSDNPVGPKGIAQGIEEMFASAGIGSVDKKLDLLERLAERLAVDLPPLYTELNRFLETSGVEASQAMIIGSTDSPQEESGPSISVPANHLFELQQSLLARLPQGTAAFPAAPVGPAAALLSRASTERALSRLNDFDNQGRFNFQSSRSEGANSLESLIPGLFDNAPAAEPAVAKPPSSAELGLSPVAPEGLAIDTLALIFETIFKHPKLPDGFKAAISSLQIILLKVAMQDAGFFNDAGHPARQFLDRMGQAVVGLPPETNARHPVCARLLEIAGQLRAAFRGDVATFSDHLADVDALIEQRGRQVAKAAEAYQPLLAELYQRDQAGVKAREAVAQRIVASTDPAIRHFLEIIATRALQHACLAHGEGSPEWKAQLQVFDDLLWTFEPKSNPVDRKAMAKRLPEILMAVNASMARIGIPDNEQSGYLDSFFALHTKALRTNPDAQPLENTPHSRPNEAENSLPETVMDEISADNLSLRTLELLGSAPGQARTALWSIGDWLEIRLPDDQTSLGRVCQSAPDVVHTFLCNPDTGLALAVHPAILERQIQAQQARLCRKVSLFDEAAALALGQSAA